MQEYNFGDLGDLANPQCFHEPIQTRDFTPEQLRSMLTTMLRIRLAEEVLGEHVGNGTIKCPCHLAIGQEAVAVGVSHNLARTDRVFGTHRSHSHFLAQGGTTYELFAEVLGKETGCSKGMGGSMHLYAAKSGFIGSVPIVGATVPMAVGAALAAQLAKTSDVAVCYFGDGAMEEGAIHESMNFASQFKLPVLFVVENNLFSSHLHISERQPANSVARFAKAHEMPFEVIDGNDVVQVALSAGKLIKASREGKGAGFLEAITYRWRGHVGHREDIDVGVQRKENLVLWKKRDPIARLVKSMESQGMLKAGEFEKITDGLKSELNAEWQRAVEDPYPVATALLDRVYKKS